MNQTFDNLWIIRNLDYDFFKSIPTILDTSIAFKFDMKGPLKASVFCTNHLSKKYFYHESYPDMYFKYTFPHNSKQFVSGFKMNEGILTCDIRNIVHQR